jgi:hypothetical protein
MWLRPTSSGTVGGDFAELASAIGSVPPLLAVEFLEVAGAGKSTAA